MTARVTRSSEFLRLGSSAAAMLGVAVGCGLGIGFLLVPRAAGPGDPTEPAPVVQLLGAPLPLDEQTIEEASARVRRYLASKVSLELGEGKRAELPLGKLGAQLDRARLAQLIRDTRDPTSPLRRARRSAGLSDPLVLPLPIELRPELAIAELERLKDSFDRLPVDARMDLENKRLVPESVGKLLDVDRTYASLRLAAQQGAPSATASFEERLPRRRTAQLNDVVIDDVIGWFETNYQRGERYEARTYNLRLAASKLDGTVLMPGEVFDFNEVVGPRDEAAGYKVATVIAQGELVDGIGGGTCQISGTLHGAAFFAGLQIVERYAHTRPSSYIKMGMDATVVYPTITFRVANPFSFPVVLHQTVKDGVVRAEILGPKRTRTVTMIRKIDGFLPFEEQERPDPSLPEGLKVLSQRGVPGFRLHRYRIVREGQHAVRERWNDVYPPTTQIVRVGTGALAKEGVRVQDDPHPEYLADELLTVTQGPDDGNGSGGSLRENREPGRYGKPGWTEQANMPHWRGSSPP